MVYCSGLENPRCEWLTFPETGGVGRFCPALYAQFLLRSGYGDGTKVGTPPALPIDHEETPLKRFERHIGRGIAVYTYFARGLVTGRIKIGQSRSPQTRLKNLAYEPYGERCGLMVVLRGGHLERMYHGLFEEHREIGEWFAPHPDILAEVDRLTSPARLAAQAGVR